jgi:guanylate kinase
MSVENASQTAASGTSLGMLLVISGPSGVGKDTVWKAAQECLPDFKKAITCTTRPQRDGEEHGVHYYFVSDEEFDQMLQASQLLEWAHVHKYRYGIPAFSVLNRITEGHNVACIIDVQGALTVRNLFPGSLLVFLKPPPGREAEILAQRMRERSEVAEDELETRIETARGELSQANVYDHQIINDDIARAARELCAIVAEETRKRSASS